MSDGSTRLVCSSVYGEEDVEPGEVTFSRGTWVCCVRTVVHAISKLFHPGKFVAPRSVVSHVQLGNWAATVSNNLVLIACCLKRDSPGGIDLSVVFLVAMLFFFSQMILL